MDIAAIAHLLPQSEATTSCKESQPEKEWTAPRAGKPAYNPNPLPLESDDHWRKWVIGLDEEHHPKIRTLAQWGEWFIRRSFNNRRDKGTWLVLQGLPGCGKTHVARRVRRFLADYAFDAWQASWSASRGIPVVVFREWPKLAEIKDESHFDDAIQDVLEADIVILDDLGAETDRFKSGSPASRARSVLSALERRWVLITTNLPKTKLSEMYNDRVADRLNAAHWCDASTIPSYRSKLKSQ
jgi:hypothetical protein